MTAHPLERRCEECGRTLHAQIGDACPFCGGTRLQLVAAPTPAPAEGATGAPPIRNASVFTAALTFGAGFFLLRWIASAANPAFAGPGSAYGELLGRMQWVVGVSVLIYVVLRRALGDFRALATVTLLLFGLNALCGGLIRGYGFLALNVLSETINMTLCVFASLALSAGLAEAWLGGRVERTLNFALTGLLFLGAARLFLGLQARDLELRANAWLMYAEVLLGAGLLVALAVGARRARPRAVQASSGTTPAAGNPPREDPRLIPDE